MPHKWQSCLSCHTQTKQQLLTVVTEQSAELEMLQNQLRYVSPSEIQSGCCYSLFCPHRHILCGFRFNQVLNIKMEIWIHGHASSLSVVISIISIIHHNIYKYESVAMALTLIQMAVRDDCQVSGLLFFFPADVNSVAVCHT